VFAHVAGLNPLLSSPNVLISLVNGNQHVLKLTDYTSSVTRHYHQIVDDAALCVTWMAPETVRKEALTAASEVWSFGVIVWELFTMKVPYVHHSLVLASRTLFFSEPHPLF
jgi:serine/threonine protein kinase